MEDDDLLPISALQHYLYCPRQCALIHIEQAWAENRQTAEGRLLHERADKPRGEQRRGVRTVTAMPLSHPELGLTGIADVIEFRKPDDGGPEYAYPVEYKRGRPKAHRADEVQLCAQAICLESMLGTSLREGALFYGETRRRTLVVLDAELRQLTVDTIHRTREMLRDGTTPTAAYQARRCDACSLMEMCQPRLLERRTKISDWLQRHFSEGLQDG